MDTEEHLEIQKALRHGHPETDEGPYYHESWWESYKGSVKGKFGGAVVGALIGAAMGLVAAAVVGVFAAGGVAVATVGMLTAGFAAAGMLYGAHEFSEIGKVTGAVAAAQEKSETRMKSFESGKFAEIKKEIRDIKSLITGKKAPASDTQDAQAAAPAGAPAAHGHARDYRTNHCDDLHCPPGDRKLVFWNIATIGLIVGLAAGALLAAGGVTGHVLHALGVAAEPLHGVGLYAASMTAVGLFGASFGINRDIFRKIFDTTDRWFKGIVGRSPSREPQVAVAPAQQPEQGKSAKPTVNTVVYENYIDYPQSDTFHQDREKALQAARDALLKMDHTKHRPC